MLAAVQAPIIMMSQNRQAAKDRLAAALGYEINVKAESAIAELHEKVDQVMHMMHGMTELPQVKAMGRVETDDPPARRLNRVARTARGQTDDWVAEATPA